MRILTPNVANSKNYKFSFMYSLCFLPISFIVFEFKYPQTLTIYGEFHTFFTFGGKFECI